MSDDTRNKLTVIRENHCFKATFIIQKQFQLLIQTLQTISNTKHKNFEIFDHFTNVLSYSLIHRRYHQASHKNSFILKYLRKFFHSVVTI